MRTLGRTPHGVTTNTGNLWHLCNLWIDSCHSGAGPFHADGDPAGFDLLDLWRWSTSDLVTNTTLGVLAEYIVARALGIGTDGVRQAWRTFDLLAEDGWRGLTVRGTGRAGRSESWPAGTAQMNRHTSQSPAEREGAAER